MLYRNWLNEWLTTCVKPSVKTRTYKHYTDIVRLKIEPRLGGYDLTELTPARLQSFTAELAEVYSSNTVTGVISVIKNSLARAQKTGLIESQHAGTIEYPRPDEKPVDCFTRAEQSALETYAITCGKSKYLGVLVCLYTGLRIGELLALEWQDVDFKNQSISVTKTCLDTWTAEGYVRSIGTTKTAASRRVIPLPTALIKYLKKLKKESKSKFVISGTNGEDISVRSYQKSFSLMLKKLDIAHRGFHALRHTFATRAIECGMDVRTLSGVLGHKSTTMTLNRYAHSLWEHQNAMMNRVGKMLTANATSC